LKGARRRVAATWRGEALEGRVRPGGRSRGDGAGSSIAGAGERRERGGGRYGRCHVEERGGGAPVEQRHAEECGEAWATGERRELGRCLSNNADF
jgi:hypothetical protein